MGIAEALIAIITNAPSLISEATVLYTAVKSSLSSADQATVDTALAAAQASDATATERADNALDAAAAR